MGKKFLNSTENEQSLYVYTANPYPLIRTVFTIGPPGFSLAIV